MPKLNSGGTAWEAPAWASAAGDPALLPAVLPLTKGPIPLIDHWDTFDHRVIGGGLTQNVGVTLNLAHTYAPKDCTLTQVDQLLFAQGTAALTVCRMLVYDVAEDGSMTLIASSNDDNTANINSGLKLLSFPLLVPVALTAGQQIAVGVRTAGTGSGMSWGCTAGSSIQSVRNVAPYESSSLAALSGDPATIASNGTTHTNPSHWCRFHFS